MRPRQGLALMLSFMQIPELFAHLCRCLAHIINLATQAIISMYSKSKFYNGDPEDNHTPEDVGASECNEIGIIRAICVKAHSSAQCKEAFKAVQYRNNMPPIQLLLDMKVRWSLTYVMLTRAESRQRVSDDFLLFSWCLTGCVA
jgi:hypothetical protein